MCPHLIICTAVLPKKPEAVNHCSTGNSEPGRGQKSLRKRFLQDLDAHDLGRSLLQLSDVTKDVGIFFVCFESRS